MKREKEIDFVDLSDLDFILFYFFERSDHDFIKETKHFILEI